VKALENDGADPDVIILTIAEADLAQRMSDTCQQFSAALASQSDEGAQVCHWLCQCFLRDLARGASFREYLNHGHVEMLWTS